MIGLDQQADVYTLTATTGKFTTLARQGLACRLIQVPLQRAQNQADRRELAALRNMIWDPDYQMPENAQVLVDGVRWGTRAGTFNAWRDQNSICVYRSCDVFRQETTAL